ncbi:methyl-accepting chemotaxis protein [Novosphingobium sp. SL115]|uniref:methyl-accepting chemotaxis protein n=1 Tax=Novosphingobium sp. SL115 TaxID=2995150 RepID=UPI00227649B1|nr:methyl-accepting chemotaxis protein [Novosphingobium sp. SL115]MCY1670225.1 methyl-accepting chemotaxis protein [Novosphingobium sp. SL115]
MIKDQTKRGARLVMAMVVIAIVLAAVAIAYIRFGGPLHRENLLQDELLADILPPPAFVVEPYLHATWAIEDPAHGPAAIKALREQRALFEQRKAYWAQASVPDSLRGQVNVTIGAADQFWAAVDTQFNPALARGDIAAMRQIHASELVPAYEKQHAAVAALVEQSGAYRADLMEGAHTLVGIAMAAFVLMAAAILTAVHVAGRRIGVQVVDPLVEIAHLMERMADGQYDCDITGTERSDEMGMMARAMAVFRSNGLARERAAADQRTVVAALSAGLERMAGKDLEFRIDQTFPEGYDELRQDYNSAVDALAQAMRTVRVGATGVMSAITEIRAASDDLAHRNEQQAASLADTASAMNAVTGSVQQTAAGALRARDTIASAHHEASEGGEVVQRAVQAMAAIEASAQEIGKIISVIDGIAFQTNLLALNAGVEAARAGDAGKGFAVVATEVRALAQRSAEAASNIKDLILTSTAQVEQGVALVGATGEKLTGIVDQVAGIDALIDQIAATAGRQAQQLQQVNVAVADMDRMTQANAAMVEESSAATHSLAQEAEVLTELVTSFRTRDLACRPAHAASPDAMRRQSAGDYEMPPVRVALAAG